MTGTLFESDPVRWSDEQAAALRRLARSGASNAVDWDNVIEEVESVGRNQRHAVHSLLTNALIHLLKMAGDPDALSFGAWSREVVAFLEQASARSTGAIRADLDLDAIWQASVRRAGAELRAYRRSLPADLPVRCPFDVARLLDHRDVSSLLATLVNGRSAPL